MEITENSQEDVVQADGNNLKKRKNPFNTQRLKEEKERRQKKRARLIIRNISYKSTEDSLKEHFSQWGTVEEVNILKRGDGKLVGCAFVQYETINQATKAILKGNNKEMLGRPVFVDWALGKDEFTAKKKTDNFPAEKKPKVEIKDEEKQSDSASVKLESGSENSDEDEDDASLDGNPESNSEIDDENIDEGDEDDGDGDGDEGDDDIKNKKKSNIANVKHEKHTSNDVQQGCTVFIKNVPFDAEDTDLRKVCRKFGLLHYAIINRDKISGHSKGTAFVKFKAKESADLFLQSGTELTLLEQVLDPHPALSREEIQTQAAEKSNGDQAKDSRNLYLAREGLIMSGSKAADGVSASDMTKRHNLEQVKTQVLKNLNRFVSRNRLSIHNLPLNYDNEKLKQMAIAYTGYRPHECRVMRENQITAENPKGKSKGFGFLSFSTHQEALTALRKLNNNPKIFGGQHRPIVAFSIEDRAIHKIKEKREEKSKVNNPTFQEKLQKRKERRQKRAAGRLQKQTLGPQDDNKTKLKKHIEKLETSRAAKADSHKKESNEPEDDYVGMVAKQGTSIRMRSNKKIKEQAQEHMKRIKTDKKKKKQQKIKQLHLAERKANDRPKQGRKVEKDDLTHLVNKYKRMISKAQGGGSSDDKLNNKKKPKRTKWYAED